MNAVFDVAIVGGGMAGASLAAEVALHARVVLIEAESAFGYHATGRSAAFWSQTYGGPGVQPLTTASGPLLHAPPADMGGEPFVSPRGDLLIGRAQDEARLTAYEADFAGSGVALERVDPRRFVSGLRPEWDRAIHEPSCTDIDVARLHAAYLTLARRRGAVLLTRAPLSTLTRTNDAWAIEAGGERIVAGVLANAAGAWADGVAAMAGAAPIGIRPLRRTMVQLRTDPPMGADAPLVRDAGDAFYFKPEAGGRVWLSPHDEVPDAPRDVAAEEIDVAVAIDRFERVVDWRVDGLDRRWAGLRSFAPDRLPVYGFDPATSGFYWFAGQGGFGIQTAPAAALIGAAQLTGRPADDAVAGIDATRYAPDRFRAA